MIRVNVLTKITSRRHVEIWRCQLLFGFQMARSNAAIRYVAKISMLRLNIGTRAWPHAVISSLGARVRRGVVRLWRSVSHVVGHGHWLTSGWVPLGLVGARRGSSGTRMGPYLSRTLIRVHRVICQGPSGPVGRYWPHRPKFGQVQKHQI